MLTSWSEVSTPAELSMKSVLSRPPLQRVLDAAALREAEVAAFADHLAAQLPAVDAHARRWRDRRPRRAISSLAFT